jgi:hypothetical protein
MRVKAAGRQHTTDIVWLEQRDLNALCRNGLHGNSDVGDMQFPYSRCRWIQQQTSLRQSEGDRIRGVYIGPMQLPDIGGEP